MASVDMSGIVVEVTPEQSQKARHPIAVRLGGSDLAQGHALEEGTKSNRGEVGRQGDLAQGRAPIESMPSNRVEVG